MPASQPPGAGEPRRILDEEGRAEGPVPMDAEALLGAYRLMVLVRAFDARALNLQRQGRISFYAGSLGQEAAIIGSALALGPDDWCFPTYRELGAFLARGLPLRAAADQLYGNRTDLVRGRQMPNHWASRAHRMVSISSPIATQIPQAAGLGMAQRLRGERAATLCYLGDGATSEGDFHAGLNFAGVYRAHTVFFCQNNQWAIAMPVTGQTASASIAVKAVAYGIEGVRVDGNDLVAVHEATREALERARAGGGPTLIEALTYRLSAHSTSDDPRRYRPDGELEAWQQRDPIARVERYLVAQGALDADGRQRIADEAQKGVLEAIAAAEREGPPEPGTLFEDVFAEPTPRLEAQRAELLGLIEQGVVPRLGAAH